MATTPPTCRVVTTREGTYAMFDSAAGEVMHPVGRPGQESLEVYVQPARLRERLLEASADPVVLLDVGLGAGSNAVAAWRLSESLPQCARPLHIVSFDNTTAALEVAVHSEHAATFDLDGPTGDAARAVLSGQTALGQRSRWRLVHRELPDAFQDEPSATADVVFWDMYSPKYNPALWSIRTFESVRRLCRPGATLHTYSAATASRAAMLLAGFAVGHGPITGERETTVAALAASDLKHPLGARWLAQLSRSSVPLPVELATEIGVDRDGALAQIRSLPQFEAC